MAGTSKQAAQAEETVTVNQLSEQCQSLIDYMGKNNLIHKIEFIAADNCCTHWSLEEIKLHLTDAKKKIVSEHYKITDSDLEILLTPPSK